MKRAISFIMVLLCIICLSSCGKIISGSLEKESNNDTTPSQQVSKDEEASKEVSDDPLVSAEVQESSAEVPQEESSEQSSDNAELSSEAEKVPDNNTEKENTDNYSKAKSYVMTDYSGMTINDVAGIWGKDYVLEEGLYAGGWKGVYYEDGRCPFIFYYSVPNVSAQTCTGNEELSGIMIFPTSAESKYYVSENIPVTSKYSEISTKLEGEFFENLLDGGYSFSGELSDKARVLFTWMDDVEEIPLQVTVTFK